MVIQKAGNVVRIFRTVSNQGYTQYTVSYYQFGKRHRECFGDEQAARDRARAVLKTLVEGEVEATNMRLQDVKAYNSALNILAPTGVSLETACREYAEILAILKKRATPVQVAQEHMERLAQANQAAPERERPLERLCRSQTQKRRTPLRMRPIPVPEG